MTLVLFAFACGLLIKFAACAHQRRFDTVALKADKSGVRNSPDISEGVSS